MALQTDVLDQRPRGLVGLFREAWRRQRRRRLGHALILITALVAAAVLLRDQRPSGGQAASTPAVSARLTSSGLPASGHFASLSEASGRLIAAGGPANRPLNVSGATTSLTHDRATGRCTAATVVPGTVRLERLRHANCGDPALYGLRVMPIMYLESRRPVDIIGVRIAVADPAAPDGYQLGPTVMSYEQCSDCAAQWIIGDHALWINSALAHGAHGPGEILKISTSTGRVQQRSTMPQLFNVELAVNADGLWVAPSILTGIAGRPTPQHQRASTALYLDAPGVDRAKNVLQVGEGISWLAASGHHVWLGEIAHGSIRMLTFTGPQAAHLRESPRLHVGRGGGDELGNGTIPYAVNPKDAVYGVGSSDSSHQTVIAYDTTTLTAHVLATTPRANAFEQQPDAVAIDASLYFLDAAGPSTGRLYRLATH
jgi:hypothetical protein